MTFFFVPSRVIGLSLFVRVDFLKVDFHHSGDVQNVYLTRGMGRRHGGSASQRQRVSESLKFQTFHRKAASQLPFWP